MNSSLFNSEIKPPVMEIKTENNTITVTPGEYLDLSIEFDKSLDKDTRLIKLSEIFSVLSD